MRIFNKMKGLSLFMVFQIMFFSFMTVTYAAPTRAPTNLKPSDLKIDLKPGLKPGAAIVLDRDEITKKGVIIEKHDFVFDGSTTFQDMLDEIKDPDAKACAEALVANSVLGDLKDDMIDGLVITNKESLKPSSLKCDKVFVTLVPNGIDIDTWLGKVAMVSTGDGWMAKVSRLFVNEAHAVLHYVAEAAIVGAIIGISLAVTGVISLEAGEALADPLRDLVTGAVDAYCNNQPDKCGADEGDGDHGGEEEELEEEEGISK